MPPGNLQDCSGSFAVVLFILLVFVQDMPGPRLACMTAGS